MLNQTSFMRLTLDIRAVWFLEWLCKFNPLKVISRIIRW